MAQAVIAPSSSHGCLSSSSSSSSSVTSSHGCPASPSSSSVPANFPTSRLLSSQACNLSVSVSQVASCRRCQRRLGARIFVKCVCQDESPVLEEKVKPLQPAELNLPLEITPTSHETLHSRKGLETAAQMLRHGSRQQMKEALQAAKKKYGKMTVSEALQEAKKHVGKDGLAKLALFGGVGSVGLLVSGAVLTSIELLPLAPEALQIIGVAYSLLLASQLLQGKPAELAVSPIKAVLELVDSGNVNPHNPKKSLISSFHNSSTPNSSSSSSSSGGAAPPPAAAAAAKPPSTPAVALTPFPSSSLSSPPRPGSPPSPAQNPSRKKTTKSRPKSEEKKSAKNGIEQRSSSSPIESKKKKSRKKTQKKALDKVHK
ncbi:unnamed protein product [Sphagnum jensenii]|uniref:Uncharacterized protein n=1 Tax=Sphagnum jensenii TaxID=128206 RepID=A0ABP1AWH1_9BRYO